MKEAGACFGEKLGWERPNWFADLTAGRGRRRTSTASTDQTGSTRWPASTRRARDAAALFDQTSFAKFRMVGPDSEAALSWICANDVTRPPGRITYTQMLNDKGGIECDLTVARTGENDFYIVTGTGFATHDFDWIRRNIPAGMNAQLVDVTSSYAVLSLMGPRSRDILQATTRDPVDDMAFPFGHVRTIAIAGAPVLALRITYVGELGWELHVPSEYAIAVFEALRKAGADFRAAQCRLPGDRIAQAGKGYRAWGADIGPDHTPLEAGLRWAVKLGKNADFKGRSAIELQNRRGFVQDACLFYRG